MPKLPMEKTGELTAGESQRSIPTPFLTKTYQLVDDRTLDDMISWNEDGTAFVVWRPAEFARDLLPKFFKHNNFSSFIRQLNTYGFRKIVSDRWEFAHDCFRRNKKYLLRQIQRRKISPSPTTPAQPPAVTAAVPSVAIPVPTSSPANSSEEHVVSSNSSPLVTVARGTTCIPTTELVEENERLREENAHLRQELDDLRGLCSNVVNLMSSFTSNQPEMDIYGSEEKAVTGGPTGVQEEEDASPRLFGVPIGVKRVRRSEIAAEDQGEDEVLQARRFTVKSEPSN